MGVGVQRERRIGVTQNAGEGLGIYTAGESVSCEGVAQIVEANTGQPRPLEQCFHMRVLLKIPAQKCLMIHRLKQLKQPILVAQLVNNDLCCCNVY